MVNCKSNQRQRSLNSFPVLTRCGNAGLPKLKWCENMQGRRWTRKTSEKQARRPIDCKVDGCDSGMQKQPTLGDDEGAKEKRKRQGSKQALLHDCVDRQSNGGLMDRWDGGGDGVFRENRRSWEAI